jgi:hypothetical protein
VTVAALNEQHYREITRGKTSKSSSSFFIKKKQRYYWHLVFHLLPSSKNVKNV